MDSESTKSGNKGRGTPSASPRPQRDQRRTSRRNTDGVSQDANKGQANGNSINGGHKQGEETRSSSRNQGRERQSHKRNSHSNSNQKNQKQFVQKGKKEESTSANGLQPPIGNERFDNSRNLDSSGVPVKTNKFDSAKVAESARLQSLLPTGPPAEVQQQVGRVHEAFPSIEPHIILGVLEDFKYDENRAVDFFLNDGHKGSANSRVSQPWNAIVRKGMPKEYEAPQSQRGRSKGPRPGGQGRQHDARQDKQPHATQQQEAPFQPEEIVNSLESAIMTQLRFIQEQTKMLHSMQAELHSITETGGSEMNQLINEQTQLEERKQELHAEMHRIDQRLSAIHVALEDQKKAKAERIKNLASKSQQYGLLKTQSVPQNFPSQ